MIFARSWTAIGAAITLLAASVLVPVGLAPAAPRERAAPLATDGPAAARPWIRYGGWPNRDTSKFNSLSAIVSPPPPNAPRKITTPVSGDPIAGQKLVADRTRGGSCIACHVMGPAGGADLPGNVGPDLSEIGRAGREDEWLFNYIYDARVHNPRLSCRPGAPMGF